MQGIMFTKEMTLANLEGRKSRTSRCRGLDKINQNPDEWVCAGNPYGMWNFDSAEERINIRCPYDGIGSELYAKETYWQYGWWDDTFGTHMFVPIDSKPIYYCNTLPKDIEVLRGYTSRLGYYKRSAMMMPEWASRYHIILTGIGAQRIQKITPEDIEKEGTPFNPMGQLSYRNDAYQRKQDFKYLWDSINFKTHPWSRNDWVWYLYYTVKRMRCSDANSSRSG